MDWGGTADTLDLRPFSTRDVYIEAIDQDNTPASLESLQIVTGPSSQVLVFGQFGDYFGLTSSAGMKGRIEKIIFADATITDMTMAQASASSTEGLSDKQTELAEAAPRLAKEARALADLSDPTGAKAARGRSGPGAEVGKQQDQPAKDTKEKQEKQAKQTKKQSKPDKQAKDHDKQEDKKSKKHDK